MIKFLVILSLLTAPLSCSEIKTVLSFETNLNKIQAGELKLVAPSPKRTRHRYEDIISEDFDVFGGYEPDYSSSPDLEIVPNYSSREVGDEYEEDDEKENVLNFRNRPVKKYRSQEEIDQENFDPSILFSFNNAIDIDAAVCIQELDLKDIPREFPSYPRISSCTATFLYHGNMYSHDHIYRFRK